MERTVHAVVLCVVCVVALSGCADISYREPNAEPVQDWLVPMLLVLGYIVVAPLSGFAKARKKFQKEFDELEDEDKPEKIPLNIWVGFVFGLVFFTALGLGVEVGAAFTCIGELFYRLFYWIHSLVGTTGITVLAVLLAVSVGNKYGGMQLIAIGMLVYNDQFFVDNIAVPYMGATLGGVIGYSISKKFWSKEADTDDEAEATSAEPVSGEHREIQADKKTSNTLDAGSTDHAAPSVETVIPETLPEEIADTIPAPSSEKESAWSKPRWKRSVSSPDSALVWDVGTNFEMYEVVGLLGEGGMGQVHRVLHKEWELELAVKSPKPAIIHRFGTNDSFIREAETWVKLGFHPNITACHYVRDIGGTPRVFVELVDGGSLKEWIEDHRLYEGDSIQVVARIIDIAIQTAWGLHYAHEHGLIHQDVKPANILMTQDGAAKVTDFGLARAGRVGVALPKDSAQTALATFGGGTPAYWSPEQAKACKSSIEATKLSRRTDIWSWAVSVLEMFTGEVFWSEGQVAGAALEDFKHSQESSHLPEMPEELKCVLSECLAVDVSQRPNTFLEVAALLIDLYQALTDTPYPREIPDEAELKADALTNHALSLLDIGREEEAIDLFHQALGVDSQHLHANYNLGLYQWRTGQLTDDRLVQRLQVLKNIHEHDPTSSLMPGLIHIERGDQQTAQEVFASLPPKSKEVLSEISSAFESKGHGYKCRWTHHCDAPAMSVALGHRGELLYVGGHPDITVWNVKSGNQVSQIKDLISVKRGGGIHKVPLPGAVGLNIDGYPINALAPSADNQTMAVSVFYILLLLKLQQDGEICALKGHDKVIFDLAMTPDTRRIITAGWDGALLLWDGVNRCFIRALQGSKTETQSRGWMRRADDSILTVAISDDGRIAVSGDVQGNLVVWDVEEGGASRVLSGHLGRIEDVALAQDGELVVSAGEDGTVRLWNTQSGACLRCMDAKSNACLSVDVTPDGCFAISGEKGGKVRIWELDTGRCLRTLAAYKPKVHSIYTHVAITGVAVDTRFSCVASVDYSGEIQVWDVVRETKLAPTLLVKPQAGTTFQDEHAKFKAAIQRARDAVTTQEWDVAVAELKKARALPGYYRAPQATKLWREISCHAQRTRLRNMWVVQTFDDVIAFDCSANADVMVMTSNNKTIDVANIDTGLRQQFPTGHKIGEGPLQIATNGTGGMVAYVPFSSRYPEKLERINVWNKNPDGRKKSVSVVVGSVDRLTITDDGRWMAYNDGGAITVVDLHDKDDSFWLVDSDNDYMYPAVMDVSLDGRWVMTSSEYPLNDDLLHGDGAEEYPPDTNARIWDTWGSPEHFATRRQILDHKQTATDVALSEDATKAVSIGNGLMNVWEGSPGSMALTWTVEISDVSISMTPDGSLAATQKGREISMWDLAKKEKVLSFEAFEDIHGLILSADGLRLVVHLAGNTAQIFHLDWELQEWKPAARQKG